MSELYSITEYGTFISKNSPAATSNVSGCVVLPENTFNQLEEFILANKNRDTDALELLGLSARRGFGKIITAKNYVGLIAMNSGDIIEILPKIARARDDEKSEEQKMLEAKNLLLEMIKSLKDPKYKNMQTAALKSDKISLFEIFIRMYIDEVFSIVKGGLRCAYETVEENAPFVKGKILFDKAKTTVNIDHHKTNPGFGDYQIINPNASSCGEVLYEYFKNNNWQITRDVADCLYVAIMTDTGNFRFENTTSKVFKIVSDLVDIGANPTTLYKNCYETKSKNFVMFQNYCVNKAIFSSDNKIAYTTVYKKDLEKFSAGDDYTDGIAETLRAIETTEVSFVVKEVDSKTTKVSMRSKNLDVSKICMLYNGGGHTFAAGCTMKYGINESIERLLKEIKL